MNPTRHHLPGRPPSRLALWLCGLRLPAAEREFQTGDLIEEFGERIDRDGVGPARRWLWRQAARCLLSRPATDRVPHQSASLGVTMSSLWRDIRYACRLIRRTPVVSAAAVVTFALGIGANVAVFSVAWPALGAPLAFPQEDRLAFIMLSIERNGRLTTNQISPGDYFNLLNARSFESMAGFNMFISQRNLITAGDPRQVRVATVTEDFFKVLGIAPIAGRVLNASDFTSDARPLVIGERLWRQQFNADRSVVGTSVLMDGMSWTVVGVMPQATTVGTIDADAWSTQPLNRATARTLRSYYLAMVGRLRPGATLESANQELESIMLTAAERYPVSNVLANGQPILARADSFRERLTGPVRPTFLLLLGGAGLVLILAGINVSGLQLTRHLARRSELAVRRALGAARGTLVRQLTIESLVLSSIGGAAGLGAAAATLAVLSRSAPPVDWYSVSPRLTLPIFAFTLALTVLAGLAIGLAPAFAASGRRRLAVLQNRGSTTGRAGSRMRLAIVGVQIATTIVLLIGATLTAASLARVLRVDPGFDIERGLIADVRYGGDQGDGIRFYDELTARAEGLPGVERACAINHMPLDNDGGGMTFVAEGKTDGDRQGALPMGITEGCFETLRIPLVSGRGFHRSESESVAIVNQSMATALWPDGADPVGKRLHIGLVSGPLFTVVGVVKDIRAASLESSFTRQVWMSASRGWPMPQRLIVRTGVPPETLAGPLRTLLRDLEPDLALANVRTHDDVVAKATASRRFVLTLLLGFAVIALVLSAVGIYGMLANQVTERTREIGIRVALGATRRDVVRAVAAPVLAGLAGGLVVGLGGARLLASLIATQLYQVSATDLRVYGAVAAFVLTTAAIACWAPTRRAARVDPVIALRSE